MSEFNEERHHQALDMRSPAELYMPSVRAYDGLPQVDCHFHDRYALVTACRRICMHR